MRKISVLVVLALASFTPVVSATEEPAPISRACQAPLLTAVALPGLAPEPSFISDSPYTCDCPAYDPCVGKKPGNSCLGGAGTCMGFMIGPDPILCGTDPLKIQCQCMTFDN